MFIYMWYYMASTFLSIIVCLMFIPTLKKHCTQNSTALLPSTRVYHCKACMLYIYVTILIPYS